MLQVAEFSDNSQQSWRALLVIVHHLSEDEGNSDAALFSVHSDEQPAAKKIETYILCDPREC